MLEMKFYTYTQPVEFHCGRSTKKVARGALPQSLQAIPSIASFFVVFMYITTVNALQTRSPAK